MLENIIPLKIKKLKSLIEKEVEEILVLEVGIEGRKRGIKSLPVNAERPKLVEELNADIEKLQDNIPGREYKIETMQMLVEKYEKLEKGGTK